MGDDERGRAQGATSGTVLAGVTIVFGLLAVTFATDLIGTRLAPPHEIANATPFLAHRNVRDPLGLKLQKAGFTYSCRSCHQNFVRPTGRQALIAEHESIQLAHGANNRCLNCHDSGSDMETFINHDGSEIAATDVERLCQKCHGPKYRDWQLGVHGRPNGYWDSSRGVSEKTSCVACHDPHAPAFQPIAPAPAPIEHRVPAAAPGHEESGHE